MDGSSGDLVSRGGTPLAGGIIAMGSSPSSAVGFSLSPVHLVGGGSWTRGRSPWICRRGSFRHRRHCHRRGGRGRLDQEAAVWFPVVTRHWQGLSPPWVPPLPPPWAFSLFCLYRWRRFSDAVALLSDDATRRFSDDATSSSASGGEEHQRSRPMTLTPSTGSAPFREHGRCNTPLR